jgi:serine protease
LKHWRISVVFGALVGLTVTGIASAVVPAPTPGPLGAAAVAPKTGAPKSGGPVKTKLIVTYAPGSVSTRSAAAAGDALSAATGTQLAVEREMSGDAKVVSFAIEPTSAELQTTVTRIAALPGVASVEPDLEMHIMLTPNDTRFSEQWDFGSNSATSAGANIAAAWDITTGSASGVVAVIDTGIRPHADLAGRVLPGFDFITDATTANDGGGRDNDANDPGDWCGADTSSWHGTHVAGTIAANGNNATGVAGINWKAKILPIRVLGTCGGTLSDIIDGIRWSAGLAVPGVPANPTPAKVANISLGGTGTCGTAVQSAINDATAAGMLVVVAAGNENLDASTSVPANCAKVLTVAATGKNGNRASYSNFGSLVEIAAPGGGDTDAGILSTLNAGTKGPGADSYVFYKGTSMATPHVAGIASLLYAVDATMTPAKAISIIQTTAAPFKAGGTCSTALCGPGLIDAFAAVKKAGGTVVTPVEKPGAFTITSPASQGTKISRTPTITWSASSNAASYEYCFDKTVNGTCNGTWTNAGTATSVTLPKLSSSTTYEVQVRAKNATGTTDAGAGTWRTFKTRLL